MSISGHKTVSMFMRYNITSSSDKLDALAKTAEHLAAQGQKKKRKKVVQMAQSVEAVSEIKHGQSHLTA